MNTSEKLQNAAVAENEHQVEENSSVSISETQADDLDVEKGANTSLSQTQDHDAQPNVDDPPEVKELDKPYSSFTGKQKIMIVLCSTLGAMFSPFTTNIYFPALTTISHDLHVSISKVNLTITTYMIFQAIAPSFISSITDAHGRRPTYVIGFTIYMLANLGLGLNNSYAGLLVLRSIQSCGSSGLTTLNQATITDIVTSAERGSYIAITSISSIVAPSVAPIIGGVLSQHLGYRSVFWFLLILSVVYLVPLLLWFPETARKVVGDGSLPPPKWNKSLLNIIRERKGIEVPSATQQSSDSQPNKKRRFQWPNPMATLAIFKDPETAIVLFFAAIAYAAFYAVSSTLTVQFHIIYGLNDTLQGLLFLPQAVGSILSAITNGIMLDKNYARLARIHGFDSSKKKQHDLRTFPIEKARLQISLPMFTANAIFMIIYGWMLNYRIHIAGPIVMLVFIGYTTLAGFNALGVLNMDLNRHRASSASAAANLARCLFGAGMTAVVNPMIEAMGVGWCFTFTGLVQFCLLPILWCCMRYGMAWRARKAASSSS